MTDSDRRLFAQPLALHALAQVSYLVSSVTFLSVLQHSQITKMVFIIWFKQQQPFRVGLAFLSVLLADITCSGPTLGSV